MSDGPKLPQKGGFFAITIVNIRHKYGLDFSSRFSIIIFIVDFSVSKLKDSIQTTDRILSTLVWIDTCDIDAKKWD